MGSGLVTDLPGGFKHCVCRTDAGWRQEIEAEAAQRNAEAYERHKFSKPWPPVEKPKPVVPDQLTEWDIE